ncbi:MAG: hypothetical protein J7501_18205 [Bdellovibrio sp.]|nr:hypothetical protein [Bdellovibrio sp.]
MKAFKFVLAVTFSVMTLAEASFASEAPRNFRRRDGKLVYISNCYSALSDNFKNEDKWTELESVCEGKPMFFTECSLDLLQRTEVTAYDKWGEPTQKDNKITSPSDLEVACTAKRTVTQEQFLGCVSQLVMGAGHRVEEASVVCLNGTYPTLNSCLVRKFQDKRNKLSTRQIYDTCHREIYPEMYAQERAEEADRQRIEDQRAQAQRDAQYEAEQRKAQQRYEDEAAQRRQQQQSQQQPQHQSGKSTGRSASQIGNDPNILKDLPGFDD